MSTAGQALGAAAGVVGGIPGMILGAKGAKKVGELFSTPQTPTLAAPNALSNTPDQGQASQVAARRMLDSERAASTSSTLLTPGGGAGLLDQPTTTSRTLLGNT